MILTGFLVAYCIGDLGALGESRIMFAPTETVAGSWIARLRSCDLMTEIIDESTRTTAAMDGIRPGVSAAVASRLSSSFWQLAAIQFLDWAKAAAGEPEMARPELKTVFLIPKGR